MDLFTLEQVVRTLIGTILKNPWNHAHDVREISSTLRNVGASITLLSRFESSIRSAVTASDGNNVREARIDEAVRILINEIKAEAPVIRQKKLFSFRTLVSKYRELLESMPDEISDSIAVLRKSDLVRYKHLLQVIHEKQASTSGEIAEIARQENVSVASVNRILRCFPPQQGTVMDCSAQIHTFNEMIRFVDENNVNGECGFFKLMLLLSEFLR